MINTRSLAPLLVRSVFLGAIAIVTQGAMANDQALDPLDRPASTSMRATQALLTAVTRAGDRLIAVGERGTILLSDDNGRTWRQSIKVPVSTLLTSVKFGSSAKGWAVGHSGVVLSSTDGGETWVKQLDGISAAKIIHAAAEQAAKANGNRPTDQRSLSDATRLVQEGADKPFLDLLVDSDSRAILVGAFGMALQTKDGGSTWAPWHPEVLGTKGSHLYAIERVGNSIYVAGEQGAVFRSTDSGKTLTEVPTPYKGSYFGLTVLSESNLLVFGLRGTAYVSSDSGTSWTQSNVATPLSLTAGTVLKDGTVLLANQAGSLLGSKDGGKSFSLIPVANPVPVVGMIQAKDNSIVLAGIRGTNRIAGKSNSFIAGAK